MVIKDGSGNKVIDFKRKIKALKRVLFSFPPLANLIDVKGADYPEPIIINNEITLKKIKDIIWHPIIDKAPRILRILNKFLKVICVKIMETFKKIFQIYLNYKYHLKKF